MLNPVIKALDRRMPDGSRWVLLAAMCIVAGACAGPGGTRGERAAPVDSTDASSMATLEQRALARWQALIERRIESAYEYLTPGYRATRSVTEYAASVGSAVRWTKIAWHQAECAQPDSCLVQLLLDYSIHAPGVGEIPSISTQEERWLFVDGQWYFLPQQ